MSDSYLDRFREDGFAVVKGVFSQSEIADMGAAFDEIYRDGIAAHPRSYRHGNVFYAIAEDAKLGRVIRMVQWPSYFNTVLDRVRLDRRIYEIVAPLVGPDIKQIINQLHWKPPGAAMVEFGYHQDSKSRRPREAYRDLAASYVQTGIAIDPHRAENGAMKVYPGSHLIGEVPYDPNRRTMHRAAQDDDLSALGLDPARLVTLEMEPGDFALWHVYTIHGSGPNVSGIDRRLYINGYVTAANCDRGEWAFRGGEPCQLGTPVLVHYEGLHERPEPHYVD